MKNNKEWFYGIYGIRYIWHGAWADPELIWHEKSFNYYDVENALYSYFEEDCVFDGIENTEENFAKWVKKHAFLAREILQNLLENKCFYGGY